MGNGRKFDVLIVDRLETDPRTGMEMLSRQVTVYADAGLKEVISKVEGVTWITFMADTEYLVKIDPRYDYEFVKRQIEAAVLCCDTPTKDNQKEEPHED